MKTSLFNIGVFISSVSLGNEIGRITREQQDTFTISHKSMEEAIPVGQEMERAGTDATGVPLSPDYLRQITDGVKVEVT